MIDTQNIIINKASVSRISELDINNIQFGRLYSDHMFMADFDGQSWKNSEITPFKNISLSPANEPCTTVKVFLKV